MDAPAPVSTRIFQEISRGIVGINNVRKIAEFLFPFPYAQLIANALWIHAVSTPFLAGIFLGRWTWAAAFTFSSVFPLVCLHLTAAEIERPFGSDPNDLPMVGMMKFLNKSLLLLYKCPPMDISKHGNGADGHVRNSMTRKIQVKVVVDGGGRMAQERECDADDEETHSKEHPRLANQVSWRVNVGTGFPASPIPNNEVFRELSTDTSSKMNRVTSVRPTGSSRSVQSEPLPAVCLDPDSVGGSSLVSSKFCSEHCNAVLAETPLNKCPSRADCLRATVPPNPVFAKFDRS